MTKRTKHDWICVEYELREYDNTKLYRYRYRCSCCCSTGTLADPEELHSFGGSIKPDNPIVDPVFCHGAEVQQELDVASEDQAEEPVALDEGTPQDVTHQVLVGSNGRVAVRFSRSVEFYNMTQVEAFEFANLILKGAFEARERQEGIITGKLGPAAMPKVETLS